MTSSRSLAPKRQSLLTKRPRPERLNALANSNETHFLMKDPRVKETVTFRWLVTQICVKVLSANLRIKRQAQFFAGGHGTSCMLLRETHQPPPDGVAAKVTADGDATHVKCSFSIT